MPLIEINFDGIVGPTHNYAGLSFGNLAAIAHAGAVSHPRAAALQGIAKMRHNLGLGLAQGFLLPLPRPNAGFLKAMAASSETDPTLTAIAWSASAMWAANAATVSPAPDTADRRCHVTPANLVTMPHRAQEWPDTTRQLALALADSRHFVLHDSVPPSFGDEGAANHMRMCPRHDAGGIEIFIYGRHGGKFPARQHEEASRAVARRHGLDPARVLFAEQNPQAIAAGAFHNDVVAVANEHVLLCHELAFVEPDALFREIRARVPEAEIIVVPNSAMSLAEAIRSYLFNAQMVTLPDGTMALIAPDEAWSSAPARCWLDTLVAGNGPIRRVFPIDVRQSMANGGGPACLRLRVVADPATIDPRFLADSGKLERIEAVVTHHWPESLDPAELGNPALARDVLAARAALCDALDLAELT
ncbi:MAG: N-succinylarginine dihydrolase [Novosphingobium sp.]|nr:N-succinylarginine dihydrolase [Novosphingobium sp.]